MNNGIPVDSKRRFFKQNPPLVTPTAAHAALALGAFGNDKPLSFRKQG
jgi:hypothetical protein